MRVPHEIQAKFRFELPKIRDYKFRDEMIDGCHCISGHKAGTVPERALGYFVGGGERRWQLSGKNLWPDIWMKQVGMLCELHRSMLEQYAAENIAWLGFFAGADLICRVS